jgi:hypothetical protein
MMPDEGSAALRRKQAPLEADRWYERMGAFDIKPPLPALYPNFSGMYLKTPKLVET